VPPASLTSGDGLATLRAKWNEAVEEKGFADSRRRQILTGAYRWLQGRANVQQRYHDVLSDFVQRAIQDRPASEREAAIRDRIARSARPELVDSLELGLAGITTTLERHLPEKVREAGCGTLELSWTSDDVLAHWAGTVEPKLPLRSTAYRALSVYGRLSAEEAMWFASQLLHEMAERRRVLFPHFSYPPSIPRGQKPATLLWALDAIEMVPEAQLPAWIRRAEKAAPPSEVEMDLFKNNPELARLLDEVLCAAAVEDDRRRSAAATAKESDPEEAPYIVEEFIGEVARQSGHHPAKVVELFGQALVKRQEEASSREDAVARTRALASLWSLLNES
jgi:hypothetical protein